MKKKPGKFKWSRESVSEIETTLSRLTDDQITDLFINASREARTPQEAIRAYLIGGGVMKYMNDRRK